MNAEEKLNSLIAEYRLLKTEEEKKGFDEILYPRYLRKNVRNFVTHFLSQPDRH